jgi:Flp pilus assembly protein TadG
VSAARVRRRCAGEEGQATVELVAALPVLFLMGLIAVQLQLFAATASAAEHAARNASRAVRAGNDPASAAAASLSTGQADRLSVTVSGERATVRLEVPDVVPLIDVAGFAVTRSATIPRR